MLFIFNTLNTIYCRTQSVPVPVPQYIYNLGGKGFLSIRGTENEDEIRLLKIFELEDKINKNKCLFIFKTEGKDDHNNIYYKEESRGIALDVSGRNSHLITYLSHKGENQKYQFRLTNNHDIRIVQSNLCIEYNKSEDLFFLNKDEGCSDPADEKYLNQVFRLYDEESVDSMLKYKKENEKKIRLKYERDIDSREYPEESYEFYSKEKNKNQYSSSTGKNRHRTPIRSYDEYNKDSESSSGDCRKCNRMTKEQDINRNYLTSERNRTEIEFKDNDDIINTDLEKYSNSKTNKISQNFDISKNYKIDFQKYNAKKQDIRKKFEKKYKHENNVSCSEKDKHRIDKNTIIKGNKHDDTTLDDKLLKELSALGSKSCDSKQFDSFNPICTSEINKKVEEITEMIPTTLNF